MKKEPIWPAAVMFVACLIAVVTIMIGVRYLNSNHPLGKVFFAIACGVIFIGFIVLYIQIKLSEKRNN